MAASASGKRRQQEIRKIKEYAQRGCHQASSKPMAAISKALYASELENCAATTLKKAR